MSVPRLPTIDFARAKPRRYGGALLCLLGVAVLAYVGLQAQESQTLLQAQREGLRTLMAQSPSARANAALGPEERRKRAQMETVANYLAAPWDGLLGAFESRARGKVVMRKLEPDAATGMVRMVGETQSLKSMMDYVQALEGDKRLREVVLLKHERSQELAAGASAPIEFTVVANWRAEARPAGNAAPVPANAAGGVSLQQEPTVTARGNP
ncbi:MAG: hypothetical protein IPG93_20290 [Burkholderiales bacterium]|nr:hypothetical protein [Burkholderiales bacterium]